MKYNFDERINRYNTGSVKYDLCEAYFKEKDLIPAWVADTDFRTCVSVEEALQKGVNQNIYGYAFRGDKYFSSIIEWYKKRHEIDLMKNWISYCPGVVAGLVTSILSFTRPGDKIIIQTPVYTPFFQVILSNGRQLVENPLKEENGYYSMDFEDLEKKIDNKTKMLILCSPHNPVSRVWDQLELEKLIEIARKNDIMIVSDEIHSDLVFDKKFISMLHYKGLLDKMVILNAASKTFNIAALATSYAIIPHSKNMEKYNETLEILAIAMPNMFGLRALEAAYSEGEEYLHELKAYLNENFKLVEMMIEQNGLEVHLTKPEGTFLAWLDFRKYGLSQVELMRRLHKNAKVGVQSGEVFSASKGTGFVRMNIGTQREVVREIMVRIISEFKKS
ncbi:MAG: pyridoxal phosphate-dependent aminotransferase [Fusobacteria bacterium]|nr:pyridoxal phosphate-dependent aminotransferase [Fusobacteriota bacterium]